MLNIWEDSLVFLWKMVPPDVVWLTTFTRVAIID